MLILLTLSSDLTALQYHWIVKAHARKHLLLPQFDFTSLNGTSILFYQNIKLNFLKNSYIYLNIIWQQSSGVRVQDLWSLQQWQLSSIFPFFKKEAQNKIQKIPKVDLLSKVLTYRCFIRNHFNQKDPKPKYIPIDDWNL